MGKEVSFTIYGDPVGKGRHRTANGVNYTPEKTVNYETFIKYTYIQECKKELLEGPIAAEIIAYLQIPLSQSKKKQALMESGKIRPTKKPDVDNVTKAVLDALNKFAYHDDSSVVELVFKKFYSYEPRVEVRLKEIGEE